MININNSQKWLLKLFLIFFIVTFSILIIFLWRPQYFLNDIELFIENKISIITSGKLDIGNFEGNFIEGFTMTNVRYQQNNNIIFSSGKMFIDPDLSSMLLGNIVISEVSMHNTYYHDIINKSLQENSSGNLIYPEFNYKIRSLFLNNSIVIYNNVLYKLNGDLSISCKNYDLDIAFNDLKIHSSILSDDVLISSGTSSFNSEEITFNDVNILSSWIDGSIDGSFNYKDISQSHGDIAFNKIFIILSDSTQINLENISINIDSSEKISEFAITGKLLYNNSQFDSIFIKGELSENKILFDDGYFDFMTNRIKTKGSINVEKFNWSTSFIFDEFEYGEFLLSSGTIHITSPSLFDNIKFHVNLIDMNVKSINIPLANGDFTYNHKEKLKGQIIIDSNDFTGNINLKSFNNNNYDISGNLHLDGYNINRYLHLKERNIISGEIDFNIRQNDGIYRLDFITLCEYGYLLGNEFDRFSAKGEFTVIDSIITGKSEGSIDNWIILTYEWPNIDYNIEYSNLGTSTYSVSAFGTLGDLFKIKAENSSFDNIYVSQFEGTLRESNIYADPFYIVISDNSIQLPALNLNIDEGKILFKGYFNDYESYALEGSIFDIQLENLYSITGVNNRLEGLVERGQFSIIQKNKLQQKSPIFNLNTNIIQGVLDDIIFDKLSLTGKYQNKRIDPLYLELETPLGSMKSNGWFDINPFSDSLRFNPTDSLALLFSFDKFDLFKINRYLPWEHEIHGYINGKAHILGIIQNINIFGDVQIKHPSFDLISGDLLSSEFSYNNHQLEFNKIYLATKGGEYVGHGNIPINHSLINNEKFQINKFPIDFELTGLTNDLELLTPYVNMIDSIRGVPSEGDNYSLNLNIELTGNLDEPLRNGYIIINNALLYLNPIDEVISNISGKIEIKNNKLIIDNLEGRILNSESEGITIPFINYFNNIFNNKNNIIEENINITGGIDISEFFKPDYSIHISATDIPLTSSYNLFKGKTSVDLYITGQDTVYITGDFMPKTDEFTINSLDNETFINVDSYQTNKLYKYNIHIPFVDGIQVITENMNILIEGDLSMSNLENIGYKFSGIVDIVDGRYYDNQGNTFENISGNLYLSYDENSSYIDLYANTIISPSIIDVTIMGNPKNPQIYFSDTDGFYNQTELLSMLAYGSQEIINDPNQQHAGKHFANIVTNYIEKEIERNISRNTPLDEFQLSSSGSLLKSLSGGEDVDIKLIVGKRLSNKVYINTLIDFYDFNDNQYEAEYRLSKNTSLVGGVNSNEGNNSFHIKYRIKYYY